MKKEKMMLVGGVLAGAAAGVLLGILFAPDKGSETRGKIVEKGEDYVDDLKDKLDNLVQDMNKKMKDIKETVTAYTSANCKPSAEAPAAAPENSGSL